MLIFIIIKDLKYLSMETMNLFWLQLLNNTIKRVMKRWKTSQIKYNSILFTSFLLLRHVFMDHFCGWCWFEVNDHKKMSLCFLLFWRMTDCLFISCHFDVTFYSPLNVIFSRQKKTSPFNQLVSSKYTSSFIYILKL